MAPYSISPFEFSSTLLNLIFKKDYLNLLSANMSQSYVIVNMALLMMNPVFSHFFFTDLKPGQFSKTSLFKIPFFRNHLPKLLARSLQRKDYE